MIVGGIVVLGVAAVVGVVYVQYRMKQKRIASLRAIAAGIGFEFSQADPADVLGLGFSLLNKGDGRGVESFMAGQHDGKSVECFDYWYYDESTDSKGRRSRTYHRYTCGLLTFDAAVPHLALGRENFFSRIGNALGIDDIELEYEAFNREFRVRCDDQRFAFSVLDGQMMEWLLVAPDFEAIEVSGSHVLLARRRAAPEAWPSLLSFLSDFRDHVPSVVFATYPAP